MGGLFDRLQDELDAQDNKKGLSPIDLLDMPEELTEVVNRIIRKNGMKLAEVAQQLNKTEDEAKEALNKLVEKGYVRQIEVKQEIWYKAQFGRKADKIVSDNIWSKLDSVFNDEED